jgi:ribonuclease-3 family protein
MFCLHFAGKIEEQEEHETYLGYERWLPTPPKVVKPRSVFNATSLAYIGDCIYEVTFFTIIYS